MQDKHFSINYFQKFIRLKVSLAVTFTAFAAAIIATGEILGGFIPAIAGTFLLACGASALNQVQEAKYDSLMDRTSGRPLPAKSLSQKAAITLVVIFILSGLLILLLMSPFITFIFGLFNIAWYNGVYTWLKRKTAFAVVPGSLTGAIPVLMGWTAAGGLLSATEPWLIAFFIFMWQIPHFWLLTLRYGSQYQMAGLPVLSDLFDSVQLRNIIFSWIMAASVSSIMLTALGVWESILIRFIVVLMNLLLIFVSIKSLFFSNQDQKHLFIIVNVFMMLVLLLIVADILLL